MIRHTVAFRLRHSAGSPEEAALPAEARGLANIPGVENSSSSAAECQELLPLRLLDGVRRPAVYDGYNIHPFHVAFVRDRWVPEVEEFLEIDYAPLYGWARRERAPRG
jgi:hypothetical protein